MIIKNQNNIGDPVSLINLVRFWIDLVLWMKVLIISVDNNTNDLTQISQRLYRIPQEFYNKYIEIFGINFSEQFVSLLSNFISTGRQLVIDQKMNNTEEIIDKTTEWFQIADDLSSFMSETIAAWNKEQWNKLLTQFINLMIDEMTARFSGDYNRQIVVNDRLLDHSIFIAEYMFNGILSK